VDDEFHFGLGAQGRDGGGFIFAVAGVEDGDAEGFVAPEDVSLRDAGPGLGVAGDGAVAVGDQIAVRDGGSDGTGELLGRRMQAGDERRNERQDLPEKPERAADLGVMVRSVGVALGEDGMPRERRRRRAALTCASAFWVWVGWCGRSGDVTVVPLLWCGEGIMPIAVLKALETGCMRRLLGRFD
jgi:hypothetical protein